ncbi:MAG TPA: hypothetical protein VFZ23_02295 [Pyrinomonadaceae bacterium]
MTPDTSVTSRVSILERLIPSVAFAVAALSGAIGGVLILYFLETLRQAETAGRVAFFLGTAKIEGAMGAMMAIAAVIGGIGVIVALVRMFTENRKASPPGVLFVVGVLALLPPFAIHYVLRRMEGAVDMPEAGGISGIAETVYAGTYFAIGAPVVLIIVLLAISFVPFSSRLGRKISPTVVLIIIEVFIVALTMIFFWQAIHSLEQTPTRIG